MQQYEVTIKLTPETLQKAQRLASQRGTSLAEFLVELLRNQLAEEEAYEIAKQSQMQRLNNPFNLGLQGNTTSRDELYDRTP